MLVQLLFANLVLCWKLLLLLHGDGGAVQASKLRTETDFETDFERRATGGLEEPQVAGGKAGWLVVLLWQAVEWLAS